ncbi:MAG: hypothetical protein IH987_20190 [Planctomycetes bacterium]|nr:hypothetical protein [Planctomycetota bacterium]
MHDDSFMFKLGPTGYVPAATDESHKYPRDISGLSQLVHYANGDRYELGRRSISDEYRRAIDRLFASATDRFVGIGL